MQLRRVAGVWHLGWALANNSTSNLMDQGTPSPIDVSHGIDGRCLTLWFLVDQSTMARPFLLFFLTSACEVSRPKATWQTVT